MNNPTTSTCPICGAAERARDARDIVFGCGNYIAADGKSVRLSARCPHTGEVISALRAQLAEAQAERDKANADLAAAKCEAYKFKKGTFHLLYNRSLRRMSARRVAAYCRELRAVLPVLQLGPGVSALCATLLPPHVVEGVSRAGFEMARENDSSWIYAKLCGPNRGSYYVWVPMHREYSDYGQAVAKVVRYVAEACGWSQAEALLHFLRIADAAAQPPAPATHTTTNKDKK